MSGIIVTFAEAVSAAFCIWLAVRIISRRERWAKRTAKWTAASLGAAALLYVVSVGPACWVVSYTGSGRQFVAQFYYPLIDFSMSGPQPIATGLDWWMHLFRAREWMWFNDNPG